MLKDQSQKKNLVNDLELNEWLDALENIINDHGNNRASFIKAEAFYQFH
jgi:pyruvate dehydrogenase complex dehydrogenase (E1) component